MASLLPEMDPRQRLSFSPTTPHFFKIIPVETSRYRKLRIPKKFVNNYGENLSNPVHFKLPSGAEWEIEVTRRGGEVWFDKGWPKFSEFYSLGYGDCLIFRYEWNSKFHVCIFDRSATEIEYPLPLPGMEETDEDDDESVEILEDFPPCPKTRQKSPLPSPLPRKRKRISTSIGSTSKKLETKSTLWMKPLTENEKAIALQRAIDFKSENAHFKVAMQPSYIFSQLVLPSEFAKKYLTQHPTGSAILRVPDGRTWNVKFKYDNKRARFLLGWPAFVEDNNLKIGDVCVFMLIKGFKITFEVAFYRSKEAAICSISSAAKECSGGLRTAQRGQEPFTISERSRAYKSYTSLDEPDYEGEDEDSVGISDFQRCTKKTREKSPLSSPQPLKKIRTSNKAAKKRNINFRPTKIEPRSKSAVKREDESNDDSVVSLHKSASCTKNIKKSLLASTTSGKAIALERAIAFCSKSVNPSFWIVMQPSYVTQSYLHLRSEFINRHLNMKSAGRNAILQGPNGGTWSVKLKCENSKGRFLQGWQAFVTDNNLEVDDVCVFTLMKDVKLSFKVFLFRTTEAANCRMSPTGPSDTSLSAVEAANKFVSSNPFFRVTHGLGSSRVLRIPTSFSKNFIEKKKQIVKLWVDDRMWHVNLTVHWRKALKLSAGWAAFAKGNCLTEGDVCIFELLDRNDISLKVYIFRC